MLKNDLKIDKKLQDIFNYDSIEESKNVFDEQLWYLLNEPRFDGQVEIVKEIEWLFFTSNDDYIMVGIRNNKVWSIDGDGELTNKHISLEDFPFSLWNPPNNNLSFYEESLDFCKNFLYYFDYCQKNNIELLPENFLWKEPIQKILDNNP